MNCVEFRDRFQETLDLETPPVRLAPLEDHRAACRLCAIYARELESINRALESPVDVPELPSVAALVGAKIEARRLRRKISERAGLAACLGVGAGALVWLSGDTLGLAAPGSSSGWRTAAAESYGAAASWWAGFSAGPATDWLPRIPDGQSGWMIVAVAGLVAAAVVAHIRAARVWARG